MGEAIRNRLEEALNAMNEEGQFSSAVLATTEGLPLAAMSSSRDPEATAAMAALLGGAADRVHEHLALGQADEVNLVDIEGKRLICRYFSHDGQALVLAVVAPPDQPYKRMTMHAIRAIKAALSG